MKKLLVLATIFAALALAGCGASEQAAAAKAPEAAPAQKVEQKQDADKPGVIKGTPIKGNGRSMGHF